jgi:hypothetical protein
VAAQIEVVAEMVDEREHQDWRAVTRAAA